MLLLTLADFFYLISDYFFNNARKSDSTSAEKFPSPGKHPLYTGASFRGGKGDSFPQYCEGENII